MNLRLRIIIIVSILIALFIGIIKLGASGPKVVIVKASLRESAYQGFGIGYYALGVVENTGSASANNITLTPVCPSYGQFKPADRPFLIKHLSPGRQEEFYFLIAYSTVPFAERPPGSFMKCDIEVDWD